MTRRDFLGRATLATAALSLQGGGPFGQGSSLQGGPPPSFHTGAPARALEAVLRGPSLASVTLSLRCDADRVGVVEYGPAGGASRVVPVSLRKGEPLGVELTDLVPDMAHEYAVRVEGTDRLGGRFRTARLRGDAFTFAIQADSHLDEQTDPDLYDRTLAHIAEDAPDFLIDLGDTFMLDKLPALGLAPEALFPAQHSRLSATCSSVPLLLVPGNHDGGDLAGAGTRLREKWFGGPASQQTQDGAWAFEWGDGLFICLDPFPYSGRPRSVEGNWCRSLGEAQYRWMVATLESSTAPLKLVFIHNLVGGLDRSWRGGIEAVPYFEWGGRDWGGDERWEEMRPGWGRPIHQVLVDTGVAAVFHGHDHLFARQVLDGVTYQAVPQPGWSGRGDASRLASEYGYRTGDLLPSSGYLRVAVRAEGARVEYVRSCLPGRGADREVAFGYDVRPL